MTGTSSLLYPAFGLARLPARTISVALVLGQQHARWLFQSVRKGWMRKASPDPCLVDDTMYQMNDISKALSVQDRRDVSAYVHTLKSPYIGSNLDQLRRDGAEIGKPHEGKMIAEYGAPDHGVPACKSCHGFHGRSAGRMYPAIGGQNYVYLKHELESFRNGGNTSAEDIASGSKEDNARVNDYMGQMRAVAKNLTDDDIANVAAFLTLSRPNSPGNPRVPSHQ